MIAILLGIVFLTAVSSHAADFRIGFDDVPWDTQRFLPNLEVTGVLPPWLEGTLYRNGPARYMNRTYAHWFDGLAMLHGFLFHGANNSVSYVDTFVKSTLYNNSHPNEYARSSLFSPNTAVTIRKVGDNYLSNTDYSVSNGFNPVTLELEQAPFTYGDGLDVEAPAPSHAHIDPHGVLVHYFAVFPPSPKGVGYSFYTIPQGSTTRSFGPVVPPNILVGVPLYNHAFGLTENYIILPETPCTYSRDGQTWSAFMWIPQLPVTWRIMSRETMAQIKTFTSPPFFVMHHINSYEDGDDIIVDLVSYPDNGIFDALYLHSLLNDTSDAVNNITKARPYRFVLPMNASDGTNIGSGKMIADVPIELPTIHYNERNTQNYNFTYGIGYVPSTTDPELYNAVVKLNVQTGVFTQWAAPNTFPGEPIFVPSPTSTRDDEGVLLSLVLNATAEASFLLVLDATSLQEVARVDVPFVIPFGFHGRFYF